MDVSISWNGMLCLFYALPDRNYPEAAPALLWASLPALLSIYGQTAPPAAQAAPVSASLAKLTSLTLSSVGLVWSDPARWAGWSPQR